MVKESKVVNMDTTHTFTDLPSIERHLLNLLNERERLQEYFCEKRKEIKNRYQDN